MLYVSASLGLGHVTRDLAVAREMRRLRPDVEISWLAGRPASDVLADAGETLVPELAEYRGETDLAETVTRNGRLSLTTYVFRALPAWIHNARVLGRAATRGGFDVIVGNETYEVLLTNFLGIHVLPRDVPFALMYDFLGMEVTTGSAVERLGAWIINVIWSQEWRISTRGRNVDVFFGEIEDVPDRPFGRFLPNRRQYSDRHFEFVGYALPFAAEGVPDRRSLRQELGYPQEPLVVCSVGGTSIGRELLELCGRAFPLAAARMPGLRMVLVSGPRIDAATIDAPEDVECRGMVPELWRHMAASDLAIVQGGGTSTLEVEALRRPFLYFPVENQSEQEVTVAGRLERHNAGIRMRLSSTTPETLAEAIVANLGAEVTWTQIPIDGARRAAEIVMERAVG